jgi:FkbM family methyltransferase
MKTLQNILTNSYDNQNLESWFARIYREVEEYSRYLNMSSIGGTCVDVGANVGAFAIRYGNNFNTVFCIEPALGNTSYIEKKIREMNISNINILRRAVANSNDEIIKLRPLMYGEKNNWDNIGSLGNLSTQVVSINNTAGWHDNDIFEEVKSISLEGIFEILSDKNIQTIDLLKVDCEGSEYDFLFNKDLSKVKILVAEIHHFLDKEKIENLINHICKTHDILRSGPRVGNFTISFVNKVDMQVNI